MGNRSRTKHLRPLVADADVILLVGNRTNQNGTDSWSLYPPNARYIHLDVDSQEVGCNYEALRLVGDARLGLKALTEALKARDLGKRRTVRAALAPATATVLAGGRQDAATRRYAS